MKSSRGVESLAVFGAAPAFAEKLHVGRPNVGDRRDLLERIDRILDTKWLTNGGPYVSQFERRIEQMVGVKHAVATGNATVALEIAVRALGMTGEVIVPSFTFIATAHALQWQGITPVFCDVDSKTHTLDPARVERAITPGTTGIIGVHLWGRPCDIERLEQIAGRHRLKLLFDSAHAFGCSYGGRMIGRFGHAEVFSFHATKFVNSLEGGAIVTNDDGLAQTVRRMRNFGFIDYDDVGDLGTNGKMNEMSAAVGLTNLDRIDDFVAANCRNHRAYARELDGVEGIRLLRYDERERSNYQYVVIEVDEAVTSLSRDEVQRILWAENILARRYFHPGCHRLEPYRSRFPHAARLLPETESLAQRVLALPTGTAVDPDDIRTICRVIKLALRHAPQVRRRLLEAQPCRVEEATPAE